MRGDINFIRIGLLARLSASTDSVKTKMDKPVFNPLIISSQNNKSEFIASIRCWAEKCSALTFFLSDHLGSVAAVLDAAGALLQQQRYYPFGEVRDLPNDGLAKISATDFGYTGQRALDAQGNSFPGLHRRQSSAGSLENPPTCTCSVPSGPSVPAVLAHAGRGGTLDCTGRSPVQAGAGRTPDRTGCRHALLSLWRGAGPT